MMMAQEGLNFGLMNDFDDVVAVDDDDDGFGIDADAFFNILNEDNSDQSPLPINPFYISTDNTQESGSAIHVNDHLNVPSQTDYGAASENSAETVEAVDQIAHLSSPEMVLSEANDTSFSRNSTEANAHQMPNCVNTEVLPFGQDWFSILQMSTGSHPNSLTGLSHDVMSTNEAMRSNVTIDLEDSRSSLPWSDTNVSMGAQVEAPDINPSQVHMYDFFDGNGPEPFFHGNYPVQHVDTMNTYDNSSSSTTTEETSAEPYHWRPVGKSGLKQSVEKMKEKNNKRPSLNAFEWNSSEGDKEGPFGGFSVGSGTGNFFSYAEAQYSGNVAGGSSVYCPIACSSDRNQSNGQLLEHPLLSADLFSELSSSYYNSEGEEARIHHAVVKPNILGGTLKASQRCLSEGRSDVDDNNDLCILENMSEPARLKPFAAHKKPATLLPAAFIPQCSKTITPLPQMGPGGTKLRASDERLIYQSLVQDLSQPKSEASPPDGALSVPLLRHQRIALSWMVQKETSSLHCSGGILADDQGLGKTVSTIALILTERATSAKTLKVEVEPETLDLDEEEDKKMGTTVSSSSVRGRPSGGTLIVCPTSVIRQWDAELHSKVCSEVNLSVYVYHGNNRTKDPYELAKHDVVLTTYSIVSMEVPKQPVVLKAGNDGRKEELEDSSVQCNRKRKHSSTSDNRRSKKGMDNESGKSAAHPLARVGWFRVVLDEAQSIKNFRTRVAQACWGLRAKRRWCLSGTPIQNAVDDLYSYFRFLKYDPYSVYSSFCSMVKIPITKTPSKGYPKLQAVLKNIMLRRTKGTLLDGKPIINLPPKTVTLKKVEFSEEERDFYSRLEADSRAQFQAYADSGTVKQNYVNILLMLLRLRQACDHPFLVEGGSSSVVKSSIHTARSLPREKQIFLLNCLEGSLAICGVCKDPPEDAVVCICGHVFCNQCISLRLNGDENQCPAVNCKSELNASYVFSKATLNSCLSDLVSQDNSHIPFVAGSSDRSDLTESQPPVRFESSKIKAALEVLRSLSKPHVAVPDDVDILPAVPDINLSGKSDTAPCAKDSESSIASASSSSGNSVVKEKAIVFSQWTRMLDLLEDFLKESSIQYRRLDGTMSVAARDKAVQDFNTLPEVSVMIMSLKAASLGLNMIAACHVVLLDLWWNPTTEDQAIDRAHRIGQTRPVTVVRLTVKDTVEDRILALQQKKRELVASAFGEDEKGSRQSRLTVEDLTYLFMA